MKKDDIEIINLVPNFLKYYNIAKTSKKDERYALWKKHYNFAAVPPGEQGEKLAEKMLEEAWDKYEQVIPILEEWSSDSSEILKHLLSIKQTLGYNDKLEFVVIFFVGSFEGNAFVAPYCNDKVAICFPIENQSNDIVTDIVLVHELIHLVHSKIAGIKMDWEHSIASIVMIEGVATQLSKHLVPGFQDELYVEFQEKGWLKKCRENEIQILKGILPYLKETSSEKVFKFTMGTGTTGIEREAYYVGWKVIENMLEDGWSFLNIARMQEQDFLSTIQKYISRILDNIEL